MKKRVFRSRKGYSISELCIALVLMSMVIFLAVALLNLSIKAFLGTELQTKVIRQDAEFAAKLNDAVRESGTAFTIPNDSFKEENLTKGWNYLGLMEDVHIPAFCSRTGDEIDSAQALVYIEYVGDTIPATIPANANLLHTSDGYFLQYVLAHSFTDREGVRHDYSLTFYPTDPEQAAAQTITYEFTAEMTDSKGESLGRGTGIDVDTMLSALNAIQVVYKGSVENPAVALAFRSDFLPTYSVDVMQNNQPSATVTLVLDLSGSMGERFGSDTRLAALKKASISFVEELSKNNKVNICLIPFSNYGTNPLNYRSGTPRRYVYNASDDKEELVRTINDLHSIGGTNVGDGLRRAYYELRNLENSGTEMGSNFLILMTDGAMNEWSINGSYRNQILDFYLGSAIVPPYVVYSSGQRSPQYVESGDWFTYNNTIHNSVDTSWYFYSAEDVANRGSRAYMRVWAERIVGEYDSKTYLISMCDGMSGGDLAALQEAFNTDEVFDVNSLTDFENTFDQINQNINEVMWAFEGPRI